MTNRPSNFAHRAERFDDSVNPYHELRGFTSSIMFEKTEVFVKERTTNEGLEAAWIRGRSVPTSLVPPVSSSRMIV